MLTNDLTKYQRLKEEEILGRIQAIRAKLGKKLLFLAHNYQQNEIFRIADFTGDSLELSKKARASTDSEWILFCGVHFMAESAAILARHGQRVFMPNPDAGCPMADMGKLEEIEQAWAVARQATKGDIIPVTYVNSTAKLKAFTGREGGVCSTSGNALDVFKWAFHRKKTIFFMPDEHLGRNTAHTLGISNQEIVLWDKKFLNFSASQQLASARVILWNGFCHVHTYFQVSHVEEARRLYPKAVIIVHPECPETVVRSADLAGSTKFMQDYVENAPEGTEIILGTEINQIRNLSYLYPLKKIRELKRSLCPNMLKVSPQAVLLTLENLPNLNEVKVPKPIAAEARLALERMFEATL